MGLEALLLRQVESSTRRLQGPLLAWTAFSNRIRVLIVQYRET